MARPARVLLAALLAMAALVLGRRRRRPVPTPTGTWAPLDG